MSPPLLLLHVATTWPLPGLGLLALSDAATPHLSSFPLHTALAVEARLPDGTRLSGTATVEEVSRGAQPERALLLDLAGPTELPPGTEIWQLEVMDALALL